jgi:hypothetical protein
MSSTTLTLLLARGTSEPSFPTYGVIVGDPVVSNVSAQLSGVQGYPVQVRYPNSTLNIASPTEFLSVPSQLANHFWWKARRR